MRASNHIQLSARLNYFGLTPGCQRELPFSFSTLVALERLDSRVAVKVSICDDSMDSWTESLSVSKPS